MFDLPFHPTTNLQALGFTKRGCPIWPVMGGSEDVGSGGDDGAGGDSDDGEQGDSGDSGDADKGYPENVHPDDMSLEEQNAYYKAIAKKHEKRYRGYRGIGLSPDEVRALQTRNEELERSQMSAADQALADARAEAAAEATRTAMETFAPELAEQVVGRFVEDEQRREDVLALIDPMKFVKDGKFDADALIGHLTGMSAAFGGGAAGGGKPPPAKKWGQTGSTPPPESAKEQGLAEARRRGFIKD